MWIPFHTKCSGTFPVPKWFLVLLSSNSDNSAQSWSRLWKHNKPLSPSVYCMHQVPSWKHPSAGLFLNSWGQCGCHPHFGGLWQGEPSVWLFSCFSKHCGSVLLCNIPCTWHSWLYTFVLAGDQLFHISCTSPPSLGFLEWCPELEDPCSPDLFCAQSFLFPLFFLLFLPLFCLQS